MKTRGELLKELFNTVDELQAGTDNILLKECLQNKLEFLYDLLIDDLSDLDKIKIEKELPPCLPMSLRQIS